MGGHGLGIDVAAEAVHCVELATDGSVVRAAVVARDRIGELVGWARAVGVVAIDAPLCLSTAPHRADATLAPKFRGARCGEVALGRERGIWVPWIGPAVAPPDGWIATGLALAGALADAAECLETFPQAVFRTLAGERVAPKSTRHGLAARVALLGAAGVGEPGLAMWSHDGLDAAAAALVALHRAEGRAEAVTCGHDGSAIWLPGR